MDVVRFAEPGKAAGPIVLWIGVRPGSLSRKQAQVAAVACEKIILTYEITGVEIAFRESLFRRSGPMLLDYVTTDNPTSSVCGPLTAALGLPIASVAKRCSEGTGALYLSAGGGSETVYILTARHVVFPPNNTSNKLYRCPRGILARINIMVPGPQAFQDLLTSTMVKIANDDFMLDQYKGELDELLKKQESSGDADSVRQERMRIEYHLRSAEASIKALDQFHTTVTKVWSHEQQRVVGHIAYAPAITVGAGDSLYTEDWALIELHRSKIDWTGFRGNVIDLGMF